MNRARKRLGAIAGGLALASTLAFAGCGSDKHVAPIVKGPVLPPGTPGNTAPDSTMLRWLTGYTVGVEGETDSLLTADFRYHFSPQVDPDLVAAYGNNWGKPYEVSSLHHLLHGFTNSAGVYVPGASAMSDQVTAWQVVVDTTHADSAAWYQAVDVGLLRLTIDVPDPYGPVAYNIACPLELFFVRGDAAVLSPGQNHSSQRWYLRRCDDLSAPVAARRKLPQTDGPLAARSSSWGAVRSQYR